MVLCMLAKYYIRYWSSRTNALNKRYIFENQLLCFVVVCCCCSCFEIDPAICFVGAVFIFLFLCDVFVMNVVYVLYTYMATIREFVYSSVGKPVRPGQLYYLCSVDIHYYCCCAHAWSNTHGCNAVNRCKFVVLHFEIHKYISWARQVFVVVVVAYEFDMIDIDIDIDIYMQCYSFLCIFHFLGRLLWKCIRHNFEL